MNKFILIFSFLLFFQSFAQSNQSKKLSSCQKQTDFFSDDSAGVLIKNVEAMPKMVYLAKNARYLIESKKHAFQLVATQSFLQGNSKILCSTVSDIVEKSFSLYAPTLIDLTDEKKIGNSFWQFHISVGKSQIGIWNQKTRVFPKNSDLEKNLNASGLQLEIKQISHDEFEIIFTRDNGDFSEKLFIRYDSTRPPR